NLLRFALFKDNKISSVFQLTLHKIPFTKFNVGYLPKGPFPDSDLADALTQIGKENNCALIKIEPDIIKSQESRVKSQIDPRFTLSAHPLFTQYNYILDLTKSEEELLQNMHPKTRYNIKVAQKHGVWVEERTDDEAFQIFLKLYFETAKRQKYYGHNVNYHQKVWKMLRESDIARLLIAFYKPPEVKQPIPINAWMLFNFKDTLYYPYGGSSMEYRNVMAPLLTAWEAIKLGKKMGLKKFDLWGAAGPELPENHPWQGFTRIKKNLGGELVEYLGTYDLILNPLIAKVFTFIDKSIKLKVLLLKLVKH
ncbi:MAG: peptidoglycan bridge formation glycyltransferase FemA/FemB family protein, partial [Candidatus Daviesbacteria bacterium]